VSGEPAGTKPASAAAASPPTLSAQTVNAPTTGAASVQTAGTQIASAQIAGTQIAGAPALGAGPAAVRGGDLVLLSARALGAAVGYGCLAVFLYLISVQVYRWFRDGEWTHFGISEALRAGLVRCCVKGDDSGRLAALVHWIDTPTDWLGLHQLLELIPASLALFALSILGNSIFIYCRDRIDERRRPPGVAG
jgi:hypothetical protein